MLSQQLEDFFSKFNELSEEQMQALVESHIDDEAIEVMIQHLEDFYGIEDDEELGSLAQVMVSGFVAAREIAKKQLS